MEAAIFIAISCYLISAVVYFGYLLFQKNYLHRIGYGLMIAGFLFHSASIGVRYMETGHFPVNNLHETLLISGWAVSGVFVLFQYRFNLKVLGVFAAPLATSVLIVAAMCPGEPAEMKGILNSIWIVSHVMVIFTGEAAFAMASGIGILYLLQEHAIKSKSRGFFYRRLPSLDFLDSAGHACLIGGFTMMSIGLILGLVYAKSVWGRFWSWDPKEVWSGITWLFYAALLHERLTVGWRGRRSAIMAIIGFVVLLFTFFGVNFFLEGHHGEFTGM